MERYKKIPLSSKNKTHGGKRKGSGRPKKEKTVVMRIPKSKVKSVKKFLNGELKEI